MATPSSYIDVLLQAANDNDLPDDIPWWTLKFTLTVAKVDLTTVDEVDATNLVRNVRRAIREERKNGMRDASKEHVTALLVLANRQDIIPDDVAWPILRYCLKQNNPSLPIPDSADWLQSFTRFRRTIAGEEVEPDHQQHAPQPSTYETTSPDSTYGSGQYSDSDLEFVNVYTNNHEKHRNGKLSLPCAFSDNNEKHHILETASRRCGFPLGQRVVSVTYSFKENPEPLVIECEVVSDDLEEADIVFSRKSLDADRMRDSLTIASSEQGSRRDHSRSAGRSGEYLEEDSRDTCIAIGFAMQNLSILNLSDTQITNLGEKVELAMQGARKVRRR